ncbi:hypothetical protein J437_LFUL011783 [Ladona fulva]|uniref:Chitinase domain-containing protein 1 n=1 Tax=Ladona fulva TaxID=123851 RepID=A0A8K0KCK7_LADFU|nr:hypothetical protein J437_LFUL011783 [Ladona fulva]
MKCFSVLFLVIVCTSFAHYCDATLSKSDRKTIKTVKQKVGPVSASVRDRNLVVPEPSAKDVIAQHQTYYKKTNENVFPGTVLGYVTPWNNHGYDVAKLFRGKFSLISPVWLQIKRISDHQYEVTGQHDHDSGWVEEVRKPGASRAAKVVPRVLFDGWSSKDFTALLSDGTEQKDLAYKLKETALNKGYEGFVLEVWSQLAGKVNKQLSMFISYTCKVLHTANLQCILVVPPARGMTKEIFDKKDFDALEKDVDAFSLMTYDFSSLQRPGPNAPIEWMRDCVEQLVPSPGKKEEIPAEEMARFSEKRAKILIGLNLYGYSYTPDGGGPIIGTTFVESLSEALASANRVPKFTYDYESEENFVEMR